MQKIIADLKAAVAAEKISTDHLVIAKELLKQLEVRLAAHIEKTTAPAAKAPAAS